MIGLNFFQNVTVTEILESIMCLNKKIGINDISRKFLVICKNHVAHHLKELLNFCITCGVYPNFFFNFPNKSMYKKGSSNDISDYRPVSVFSHLSKVFFKYCILSSSKFLLNILLSCPKSINFTEEEKYDLCVFLD